ncbi:14323_t:CDS:2, partial [Dentiscutata heterogama]
MILPTRNSMKSTFTKRIALINEKRSRDSMLSNGWLPTTIFESFSVISRVLMSFE